jgi:alpha-N-arabinofuranosidase
VAELLQVLLQPEFNIANAQYWQFANEYWGMVKGYNPPYTLRPAYWVFWLYHHHFGDTLIDAKVECDSYDCSGGYGVILQVGKPTTFRLYPGNILPKQKWELKNVEGVKHWEEEDGTLVVEIQTDEDLNYYHARKRMPAEPLTGYRVSAEIRTEGLENSKGAQIQVGDGRGWVATQSASLSEEVKSSEWKKVSVDYITLPDTKEIEILARRLEGGGSKGKIWVRNVVVEKFQPFNLGAVPYLSVIASKGEKGKKIYLAIVNKRMEGEMETRIEGVRARRGRAFSLTGPSVDATNEENPENARVREIGVEIRGNIVKLSLPAHSFTVVEIEPVR